MTHPTPRNVPETQANVVGAIDRPMYVRMLLKVPKQKTVVIKSGL